MTTQEKEAIDSAMRDAACKLSESKQLSGVIVIGITNDVSNDQELRRALMVMVIKTEFDAYPTYLQMGIETLKQSLERGPSSQSTPM